MYTNMYVVLFYTQYVLSFLSPFAAGSHLSLMKKKMNERNEQNTLSEN